LAIFITELRRLLDLQTAVAVAQKVAAFKHASLPVAHGLGAPVADRNQMVEGVRVFARVAVLPRHEA
jgi:hypothetical protein